jgi:hypothetical protein
MAALHLLHNILCSLDFNVLPPFLFLCSLLYLLLSSFQKTSSVCQAFSGPRLLSGPLTSGAVLGGKIIN